jgi:ABC-2 type transport system permease protein
VLPLLLLVLTASVFNTNQKDLDIIVPGIAGMSVMTTTFTALAFNMTFLREQGILKRVRGTPLPPISYFGGLLGNAVANACVQVGIVIVIGHVAYSVPWPRNWVDVILFGLVGVIAFGSLGIALSYVIPNFDAAAAYVNAVFLPLIFISGTFYDPKHLPSVLDGIASALPLKPTIEGMHAGIVTGGGPQHHLQALAVLLAWCIGGVVLAVRYFRWE